MSRFTIGVVGNPNCGKTTLFNALTGARQRVGNWPGVTVDRKVGFYRFGGHEFELVDTPGIYSFAASSVDEQVARDYVLAGQADLIVNIVDASNLERNLYLTSQLLEMGVPVLIALNMMDVAKERQLEIDVHGLAQGLGCPVIPLVAARKEGLEALKEAVSRTAREKTVAAPLITFPPAIEAAVQELLPDLDAVKGVGKADRQWLAIKLLEGDALAASMIGPELGTKVAAMQQTIETKENEEADILIASARYGFISRLTSACVRNNGQVRQSISDRIDSVVLSKIFGIPVFLAAMYLMFMFTINLGGAFIDFFDEFAGALFVDGFGLMLESLGAPVWLTTVLAGGLGGGLQTMATFIPPIGFMFLCLSFLEDSGYMARAAFVMDRFMRVIGLPGKAFIPMLVGFGCNVPAIMATRTLENQRDRTLTIMMNPFMSCGARLPVYALFAAAFFPVGGQNLVFLLYLIGIGVAVITGLILKNTVLKGDITPFVMELPPYHLPTIKAVLLHAYERLTAFLFKASRVLIPVIVVLSFMNSLGTDGSFGNEDSENSVLATMSKSLTPALQPLGVSKENWPATVGVFTGIFAKEAVVGTLDALYNSMDDQAAGETDEEPFNLWMAMGSALTTIPVNLADLGGMLFDPLGISIGDMTDSSAAAQEMEVRADTFSSMVTLFGSKVAAFAYLLFILLYFPCSAAIAAVYRETNLRWTLFAGFWTTFMAYLVSTLFYQTATMASHPATSLAWIAADLTALTLVVFVLWSLGRKKGLKRAVLPATATT
ncbi:MAG: Fe(2+) transporter permease subunit FeoB [Deltaproteobacteria bacterium]|jgi:ferrous iron transport protein B|nr:Fe(2+) transporter permease subunit FeoB [Deltaproteobacteria bacterium]